MVKCELRSGFDNSFDLYLDGDDQLSQIVEQPDLKGRFLLWAESGDYFTADQLRAIADKLDELSGDFDD